MEFIKVDEAIWKIDKIARFLSVDPLTKGYPMLTPYQFASNTPIMAVDLDGLEATGSMTSKEQKMFEKKIVKPLQTHYDEQKHILQGALLGAEMSRKAEKLYAKNKVWMSAIETRTNCSFGRKHLLFEDIGKECVEPTKETESSAESCESDSFTKPMLKVQLPNAKNLQVAISVAYDNVPKELEMRCIEFAETAYLHDANGQIQPTVGIMNLNL